MRKLAFLVLLFFLASSTHVRAEYSSWFYPDGLSSVNNYWGNYNNLDSDDNNYNSPNILANDPDGGMQGFSFSDISNEVPSGYIINSVEIEYKAKKRWSSPNVAVSGRVAKTDTGWDGSVLTSGTKVDTSSLLSTSERVDTLYWSNNEPTHTDVSDYFGSSFDPDTFFIYLGSFFGGTSSQIIDFDYVKVRLNYTDPVVVNLDDQEASPSAQTVSLDLSGDTGIAGADIVCKTSIFEHCEKSGYAGWTSTALVATIWHEDNGNTETVYRGGSEWESYGYSATSSAWTAESVNVPYNPGYDCEYPTHLLCTEQEYECNDDGCYWTNTIVWADRDSTTLTPPSNFTEVVFDEPEPDNPLAWVIWKLKKTFWEFFTPDFSVISSEYFTLLDTLQTRAPFAYVVPVFDLDFTSVEEDEDLHLSLPVAATDDYIDETIEWDVPEFLFDFFDLFKDGVTIFLWLLFVLYLISVGRRLN